MVDVVKAAKRRSRFFEEISVKESNSVVSLLAYDYMVICRSTSVKTYSLNRKSFDCMVRDLRYEEYLIHFASALCSSEERFKESAKYTTDNYLKNFCMEVLFNQDARWSIPICYVNFFKKDIDANAFSLIKKSPLYGEDEFSDLRVFSFILERWILTHEAQHSVVRKSGDGWDHGYHIRNITEIAWPYIESQEQSEVGMASQTIFNYLMKKIKDVRYKLWIEEIDCDLAALKFLIPSVTEEFYNSEFNEGNIISIFEKVMSVINSIHYLEIFRARQLNSDDEIPESYENRTTMFTFRKCAILLWFVFICRQRGIDYGSHMDAQVSEIMSRQKNYWSMMFKYSHNWGNPHLLNSLYKMAFDVMSANGLSQNDCTELVRYAWGRDEPQTVDM